MSSSDENKSYDAREVLPKLLRAAGVPSGRAEDLTGCTFELFARTSSKGRDGAPDVLFSQVVYGSITGVSSSPYTTAFTLHTSCELFAPDCRKIWWFLESKRWKTVIEGGHGKLYGEIELKFFLDD